MDKLEVTKIVKGDQSFAVTSISFGERTRSKYRVILELAVANMNNGLNIYDIGNSYNTIKVDPNIVKAWKVDFNPTGKELVTGTNSLCVINTEDGALLKKFAISSRFIMSIKYSPSGTLLGSGNVDGGLEFYSTSDFSLKAKMEDHGLSIRDISFSPDETIVFSVSDDMHINITDM